MTQLRLFSKTCGPMMAEPTDRTTPPSSLSTDPPKQLGNRAAAARPIDRAVEHRMIGDDVVADARMNGDRHAVRKAGRGSKRASSDASTVMRPAGSPCCRIASSSRPEPASADGRARGESASSSSLGGRQRHAVLGDEAAERACRSLRRAELPPAGRGECCGRSRPRCRRCRWRRSSRRFRSSGPARRIPSRGSCPAPLVARWVIQPRSIMRRGSARRRSADRCAP